jgi:hypothetical protein
MAGIFLPGGFDIGSIDPIDSRIIVANQSARLGFSNKNVFKGLVVFQQDTQELYVLINNNNPSLESSWSKIVTISNTNQYSGSFSGSFQGNGDGLTNIPADSIVGLNLSRIISGSATASISPVNGFQINADTIITGSLKVSETSTFFSNAIVTGSLIVSGTTANTGFTNIGPAIFSGSVSTSNVFTGSGAGLTNIPADSIVGLNLTQIASETVSSSVSIGPISFEVVSGSSSLLSINNDGAITISRSINIGKAEDGTYSDGLYTDVTETTTVGTMIDRFNEILKGLSPSPAPDLNNVLSATNGGTSLLAFGSTSPTESYSNVTGLTGLSAVGFTGSFSPSNSTRLGIFTSLTNIIAVLNENVPLNGSPFINYPANAFNVPVDGGETYILEVNGAQYTTATPTGSNAINQNGFNLSLAQTGSFPATGLPFNIFRHRTGVVTIPTAAWRNGWNYVKITQGSNITNFIDWVYDPAAASGNFPYTFTSFTTGSVSPTGLKTLSGVKYYTGFSYRVTGTIGNFYKNVYTSANRSFSGTTLSIDAVSIPVPTNANSTVPINSLHTFNGQRLLNDTLSSTLSINNGFGKVGDTGTITTPTILLDNVNTANSNTVENFCLEDRRVPSASYDTQISATSALNTFPSASSLGSSELAVYSGNLKYPTQILSGGNIAGANIFYAPSSQPNYSTASGTRYFYRVFTNGTSQIGSWKITINGSSTSFVPFTTALTTNNMRIGIKVPGVTGYRDMLTPAPSGIYVPSADGVGCQEGNAISLGVQGTLNLLAERLPANNVFVLRLEVGSTWNGNISSISINGF